MALTAAHVVGSLSQAHGADPLEVLLAINIVEGSGDPRIGVVRESHPDQPRETIEIDASLIALDDNVDGGHVIRDNPTSGRPLDLEALPPREPLIVYKRGMRTPHLTSGLLNPEPTSLVAPAEDGTWREYVEGYFIEGTDPGEPFAKPGDSGSIVVDDDDCVVGMIVGLRSDTPQNPRPEDPAFMIAMTEILAALDFRLRGEDRPCAEGPV
jgi:hypothetical protein